MQTEDKGSYFLDICFLFSGHRHSYFLEISILVLLVPSDADDGGGDDDDGATQQFDRRGHSAYTEDYPSSLSAVRCVLFNARKTGVSHRGVLNGWAACVGGDGKGTRP